MILLRFALVVGIVLAVGLVPKTATSAAAQIADMEDQVVAVKNVTAKEDE
jgi:hypothetical protein